MSKTIVLRYTVPVEVNVPDGFPVPCVAIERVGDDDANDHRDGRFTHLVEDMHHAARELAKTAVLRAIDFHYADRMDRHFGAERVCAMDFPIRDHLAKRCQDSIGEYAYRLTNGGTVEVSVTLHPLTQRYAHDPHVVLSREDTTADGRPGPHTLSTRTVFEGREAAEAYAAGVSPARDPIVVPMPLDELRVGEDRGRLDYWRPLNTESTRLVDSRSDP